MYVCSCITAITFNDCANPSEKDGEDDIWCLEDALTPVKSVTRQRIREEMILNCISKPEVEALNPEVVKEVQMRANDDGLVQDESALLRKFWNGC